jgi:hypothetical protein
MDRGAVPITFVEGKRRRAIKKRDAVEERAGSE